MSKIRPLKGQYVVTRVTETETQRNGLYLPDNSQEKPQEGIVEAIPQIPMFEKTQVEVGDRVLFGKYSGTEIKFAGITYLILKEEDILAVVLPEPSPEIGNLVEGCQA